MCASLHLNISNDADPDLERARIHQARFRRGGTGVRD
jgi:hypothetical protein